MKKASCQLPWLLKAQGADALDIRYATGFGAPDPFYLLVRGTERHLYLSALEAARAHAVCPEAHIHTRESICAAPPPRGAPPRSFLARWLKTLGIRCVQVSPDFPIGDAIQLQGDGLSVHMVSASPFPQRACKRPDEIAHIRAAQRHAVSAFRLAADALRRAAPASPTSNVLHLEGRPLTVERLKNLIEIFLHTADYDCEGLIVAAGAQAARPHDTGHGLIRLGQPVVMDIFPRHRRTGYWGDFTRTVVRGTPSPRLVHMYRTVAQAQRLAFSLLRPGVSGDSVHRVVEDYFASAGFETRLTPPGRERGYIHSTGHGVGLDIHEMPRLARNGPPLQAGHIVTVEPGLYFPGVGGIRIEDTVLITPAGYRLLAACPRHFILPP